MLIVQQAEPYGARNGLNTISNPEALTSVTNVLVDSTSGQAEAFSNL